MMGNLRFRCKIGKSDDPEKMVLPGFIFCKSEQDKAKGFVIAAGWWDYHFSVFFSWRTRKANPHAD